MTTATKPRENSEFSTSRVFDAPRDLVFRAHTERERLMKWWGPAGREPMRMRLEGHAVEAYLAKADRK